MGNLEELSKLLSNRNSIDEEIGVLIGRPALTGHIGEYIASKIFDIELSKSASLKSIDGHFKSGNLAGKSVNIKYYTVKGSILDITPESLPDYYLVIEGNSDSSDSSINKIYPANIGSVYIFESHALIESLKDRGVKIGTATSVVRRLWDCAEVYPQQTNKDINLCRKQWEELGLFR